jgi:WD40 repeat protein
MLAKHDPSLELLTARFRAMYFLATPHQGSDWAKVLDRMLHAFSLSRDFVEELKKGSGALQSINEEFRHYFAQFELLSFYETQSMKHLGSRIVEPESGVLNLPRETQVPMAADHRSICKFENLTDPNYVELRNSLAMTVANISDERSKGMEVQRNHELSDLKTYLRISHEPEDDLELVEGSRLSGTCEWIAKKESFLAWRDSAADAPALLWIIGKPATGKSVLAGNVIAQLQQQKLSCSYYFFKHGEKSKSRLVNCLQSLAFQMARKHHQVRRSLSDLRKEDAQLANGATERSVWRKIFVSTIFRIQMAPPYWVIDGLDECEGSEIFIGSLLSQLDPAANLRILVTARDTPNLKAAFLSLGPHRYCGLEILTSDTVQDIKSVIRAKSQSLTVKDDGTRAALLGKVLEKSQGSFLWTLLVLEELANTYGEAELKKVLDDVPRDMNLLYHRVLDSMRLTTTEGGRRVAKAVLKWVSCAMRPLSTEELTGALNLDLGDKYDALEEMIPKLCGQLVAIDKFGNVQIVHATVREYLTSDDLQSDFAVNKSQAHTRIAEVCLNYLTSHEMRPSTTRRRGPRRGSVVIAEDSRIKFSRYACTAFSHHLANANPESVDILILVSKFLESNILSWIEDIAQTKTLAPIIRAAKDLRTYVRNCNAPPIGKEIQAIRDSTTDLVRVVAKFSDALTAVPASTYTLIPPFCPRNSTLHKASLKCRTTRLSITGLSYDHWDDRLTCIDLQNDEFTSIAYGDELFAVGTTSGVVTIYHTASCEEYKILHHGEAPRLLHFKPKSDVLASCGLGKLTVWNSRTGDTIYSFQAPFRSIALYFHNDILVVASRRNFLRSWDLNNNATLQADRPWSHSDEDIQKPSRLQPCAISFSTGHQKMAVAYIGQPITIWDLQYDEYYGSCGKILANGETSKHLVISLSFNPNPDIRLLAVSYLDGLLVLLDPFEGEELESFRANCRALTSSPNGRLLGGVAASETIHIYEFDTLRLFYRVKSSELGIRELAFSRDNFRFADLRRSQCNIWEPTMLLRDSVADDWSESTSASVIEAMTSDAKVRINTMVLHDEGPVIICGKDDGSVCLHDARTGSFLQTIHEHKSQIRFLTWQSRNSITISVDTSNGIHASVLRKDLKGGLVSDKLPFQSRLDCDHVIVQLLHSETTNRLILSTRESDYLWDSDGKQLATRPYPKNPGIRLWIQHPQSQFHAICIEGVTARIFSWDDWSQVLSLQLAVTMAEVQLKSLSLALNSMPLLATSLMSFTSATMAT